MINETLKCEYLTRGHVNLKFTIVIQIDIINFRGMKFNPIFNENENILIQQYQSG